MIRRGWLTESIGIGAMAAALTFSAAPVLAQVPVKKPNIVFMLTAMEGSLRAPFIMRWPGKVPANHVSNEIVHIVDLYTTLARVGGADVPKDRPIDGVDQLDFFLGKQETSNREGFPAYVADRLSAVKWRNWKVHLIWQESMYAPPQKLPLPKIINLLTDLKEERDVGAQHSWVADPAVKIIGEFEASLRKFPPIKVGTPDP